MRKLPSECRICVDLIAERSKRQAAPFERAWTIEGERFFTPPSLSTRLKIPGIALFSAGEPAAANDHDDEVIHHDPAQGIYKKLVLRRGRLVGAVLYGDTDDSARVWQWLCDGDDVGHLCAGDLCLGRISGQCAAADPLEGLPDDAVVCHCNGVSKVHGSNAPSGGMLTR